MRSVVLVVSCIATIFALSASSGSGGSANFGDQAWWNGLSGSERVHVVQGMLTAFNEAYSQGVLQGLQTAAKRQGHLSGEWVLDTRRYVHNLEFSKPVDEYVDGISAYYRKYAGGASLNTDVGQILGCLADSPVLNCDELAKAVEGG